MVRHYSLLHYQELYVQCIILILIEMNKQEARHILTEMQHWRRGEYPYDSPDSMPFTPKEFGEAIDFAIYELGIQRYFRKSLFKTLGNERA